MIWLGYPDSSVINYTYNGPLLWKVTDSSGGTPYAQYSSYNALQQPSSITYGNQVVTNYSYSNSNNTICSAQSFRICTIQTTRPGNLTVQNLQYGYDNKGNIKQITDVINGNQSFVLDDLDRLTSATGPYGANSSTATLTYAYNLIGNMTCNSYLSTCTASTPNYTYGNSAHVQAVTAVTGVLNYGYDLNGNMTSRGNNNLTYDFENRLSSVTTSTGSSTTTMIYDGDGGRVQKTVNGTTTIYVGKLYECTGSVCLKYIFGGNNRIAIKAVTGTDIFYYHTDHLGSSSLTTDRNGAVSENMVYLPFGQTRLDSGAINTAYKYTGQYFDSDTSLYFYGARYYDPAIGRFVSADTMVGRPRDPQTLNRYSYVRNNPIIYSDPSGHCWCMDQITQAFSDVGNAISDAGRRLGNWTSSNKAKIEGTTEIFTGGGLAALGAYLCSDGGPNTASACAAPGLFMVQDGACRYNGDCKTVENGGGQGSAGGTCDENGNCAPYISPNPYYSPPPPGKSTPSQSSGTPFSQKSQAYQFTFTGQCYLQYSCDYQSAVVNLAMNDNNINASMTISQNAKYFPGTENIYIYYDLMQGAQPAQQMTYEPSGSEVFSYKSSPGPTIYGGSGAPITWPFGYDQVYTSSKLNERGGWVYQIYVPLWPLNFVK